MSSRTLTKLIKGSIGDSNSRVDIWLEILESWINNAFLPKGIYADRELVGMYSHNVIIEPLLYFWNLGRHYGYMGWMADIENDAFVIFNR